MAYVLGYMYADGHILSNPTHRTHYICFSSTDLERIESIRTIMDSKHVIHCITKSDKKPAYYIRIGSSVLYEQILKRGVSERKSLTMHFPSVPKLYKASFIRGYFDGDGCAFIEKGTAGRPKRLLTVFTSGSKDFLAALSKNLRDDAGVSDMSIVNHGSSKTAYQLRYSTRNSLKLYAYLYPGALDAKLYLARKYDIFTQYLQARGISRSDIPGIALTKGPVAK